MLTVNNLSKSFGIEAVLQNVSFTLNPGQRLGLVGPNGSGKTTLLRILAGEEQADAGGYHFSPPGLSLGYLPQGLSPDAADSLGSFLDRMCGSLDLLSASLASIGERLAASPYLKELQSEYDFTVAALQAASLSENQRPAVLASLGLDVFDPSTPVSYLSGGQKTRLALAGVLLSSPQLLLLDEPTNHLDIEMLEWLEGWLADSPLTRNSAALIVSHDRIFLDNVVTGILELDAKTHSLRAYNGNYTEYLEQKLGERERHWQSYTDQQEEIARLRRAAAKVRGKAAFKKGGKGDSGDKFARGFFANRAKEHVRRAKHIERRLDKLMTEERILKPSQSWQMKLDFGRVMESSRRVLAAENLTVGYQGLPLLRDLNLTVRYGQRLALIGPNGSGKTTLLRTLAGLLPPLAGQVRLGSSVRLGFMAQEQEVLDPGQNALEAVRSQAPFSETDGRAFLHQYLFSGEDVFFPIGLLSFGERARLMLACLVASGCNLLLLDEPINHLDIPSRARFEQALAGFEGTVIAAVHDRYFIHDFANELWEIRQGELQDIPLD